VAGARDVVVVPVAGELEFPVLLVTPLFFVKAIPNLTSERTYNPTNLVHTELFYRTSE
jgi:hypothetical protein